MKPILKRTTAGLGALAVFGGVFLAAAAAANAADNPLPWIATEQSTAHGQAERVGGLSFYNGSGQQVYTGSVNDSPISKYVVADGGLLPGSTNSDGATAYIYSPAAGDPATWPNTLLSGAAPVGPGVDAQYTDLPASVQSSNQYVTKPFDTLADAMQTPNSLAAPNSNVYEVRVIGASDQVWYSTDIEVNPSTNTWTQIFPAPPAIDGTAVSISPSPATDAPATTTSVTLTGTVSDTTTPTGHPTGSIHVFDGGTDLGAATFTPASGAVTASEAVVAGGSYNFQFKYTATGNFASSNSPVLPYTVHNNAAQTTTVVSGSNTGTVGSPVKFTATVTATSGTPTGQVQFKDNGVAFGPAVSVAAAASSGVNYTPADTNPHTITAAYTSDHAADFANSADNTGVTLTAGAASNTPDPQDVTVHVPAGSLVISTPYTAANPLDLGTMQLSADGTKYSTAPVNFGDNAAGAVAPTGPIPDSIVKPVYSDYVTHVDDPANPTKHAAYLADVAAYNAAMATYDNAIAPYVHNGVTITDTRGSSTGWVASVSTTDFSGGTPAGTFSGDDLAFSGLTPKYIAGNHLQSPDVQVSDGSGGWVATNGSLSAFTGGKPFAKTAVGPGTVDVAGQLGLDNVPSSITPGDYTATLTFTII